MTHGNVNVFKCLLDRLLNQSLQGLVGFQLPLALGIVKEKVLLVVSEMDLYRYHCCFYSICVKATLEIYAVI